MNFSKVYIVSWQRFENGHVAHGIVRIFRDEEKARTFCEEKNKKPDYFLNKYYLSSEYIEE